jgi:predicted site-specific integrase-resolvase
MDSTPPILDKSEAAPFLRIKPRTLDEWMRKGRVPYIKLPSGAVRFRTDQLLDFLSKFEVLGKSAKSR